MKRSFRGNLKAVSPVIATIIIVAIAIVMSIAVAYWMLGLGGAFTRFEKLEFQSGYAVVNDQTLIGNPSDDTFDIKLRLKNTGSADATIDLVFLNAKPYSDYGTGDSAVIVPAGFIGKTLIPGADTGEVVITLTRGPTTTWKSGMTVELVVQTVAGRQYPKVIILP